MSVTKNLGARGGFAITVGSQTLWLDGSVVTDESGNPLPASSGEYETVAAAQSDQVAGATGAAGDFLSHLIVVPANTSPGAVSVKDGGGSAISLFAGGADSVASLHPFTVYLGMKSSAGAWKVTTGASVSAIAVGSFT